MSAVDRIKSRPPTGKVAWPCILLEGDEGAGKTWAAYEFTKSDRVGRCFAIDLGEGSADEYAPIGDYEVVEHNGTFADLYEQVSLIHEFAAEQLAAGEKPVVLTIDTMADEWGVLVDAITEKAAKSPANRKKLAEDPAAEVKVPNHLWNDANSKHRRLMTKLLTFPGIVILTSRGKEVAEVRNGAPVEGSKVWKVEGQKNLAFDVTAVIRMRRDNVPQLVKARSIHCGVRPGIDAARSLPSDWNLEWFIFDALQVNPATAEVRDLVNITDDGLSDDEADQQRRDNREALLEEVASAATAAGVPLMTIAEEWQANHGHIIQETTDLGSLELLRDDLLAQARNRKDDAA